MTDHFDAKLLIQTDGLPVFQAWERKPPDRSHISTNIRDLQVIVHDRPKYNVVEVDREANKAADRKSVV